MATEHRCGAGLLEVSWRGSALNAPPDVVLYSDPTGGTHPCFLHVYSVHTVQMHIIVLFFLVLLLLSSFLHIRRVKICWEWIPGILSAPLMWTWLVSWLWGSWNLILRYESFAFFVTRLHGSIGAWVCLWFFSQLVSACLNQGFSTKWCLKAREPPPVGGIHFQAGRSSCVCKRRGNKKPSTSWRPTDFSKTCF